MLKNGTLKMYIFLNRQIERPLKVSHMHLSQIIYLYLSK